MPLAERLALLNRMQEQAFLGFMPPKNRKSQPTAAERKALLDWIGGELRVHHASTLEDKLRLPAYGNYVDHDKLFSGEITDAPFTPARRWLVSPQIFSHRANDVFGPMGFGRPATLYGVTNPFVLPEASGVRYYDNDSLDGGALLVMLTNADWISQKQVLGARVKSGELNARLDLPEQAGPMGAEKLSGGFRCDQSRRNPRRRTRKSPRRCARNLPVCCSVRPTRRSWRSMRS